MVSTAAVAADTLVEERRQLILAAAANCIAEQGYDGVRLRAVSRQAGVSVGLIQHYFDSRDELLTHAVGFLSEGLLGAFAQRSSEPLGAWQTIEMLVDQLCAVSDLQAHSMMWIAFGAAVARHPHLRPHLEHVYRAWDEHVRGAVEAGVASGEFSISGSVDDVVAIYLAFFDGYEYDMGARLVPADTEELRRRALLLGRMLFLPRGD